MRRIYRNIYLKTYRKGSKDDPVVKALASHQCSSGLITVWCHMWVEFDVCSPLAARVFLRVFSFPLFSKPNFPKYNSTRREDLYEIQLRLTTTSINVVLIYFLILII